MDYALSLKQPWAALVVHGRKTIEIRRWSTRRRGRILIHASQTTDDRKAAWRHVTPDIEATAALRGGIIGEARLIECHTYRSREGFARDRAAHLNEVDWFRSPALYGFVLAEARRLPFRRLAGALYFFQVPDDGEAVAAASGLLVSIRSVEEAKAALDGGADLIDVKEPSRGPLGRADRRVIAAVVRLVAGRRPVSAALGELRELTEPDIVPGLSFVKCGLAGLGGSRRWARTLEDFRRSVAGSPEAPEVVTVAYADWKQAAAPPWRDVADFALARPGGVLLVDTFDKTRPTTLLDCLSVTEVRKLAERCRAAGVRLAVAGALRLPHIRRLLETRPTWFAVRGAVCEANRRDGPVHVLKVRSLAGLLHWKPAATAGS